MTPGKQIREREIENRGFREQLETEIDIIMGNIGKTVQSTNEGTDGVTETKVNIRVYTTLS